MSLILDRNFKFLLEKLKCYHRKSVEKFDIFKNKLIPLLFLNNQNISTYCYVHKVLWLIDTEFKF